MSSASHPRSQQMWDKVAYAPSTVEIAFTCAEFAAFILMYALFSKLFPLVSIWEVQEQAQLEASVVEPTSA